MSRITMILVSVSLVALPAAAQTVSGQTVSGQAVSEPVTVEAPTAVRVSTAGKTPTLVGFELAKAARQVCGAALDGGRHDLAYPSCVVETLGKARADYGLLRTGRPKA